MRVTRLMLVAMVVCSAGCATRPISSVPADSTMHSEESGLIADLEAAGETPESRDVPPMIAPRADIVAAASIPIPGHRSVQSAINLFTTELRASVQESLVRSARYKPMIDRVLEEYRLPKALAYLPVIESAYLPALTSRAGARGIWQFMPQTAREYGLRIDWWVDERADPERSTRAAAAYLKDLYREFNDWPLALAAYNCGAGRIHRALSETAGASFWYLLERTAIPAETRGYVPTFFAAITIASDPGAYGFRLADPIESNETQVAIEGPLSLRYLAEAANVDEEILQSLNPSFRRAIVPPGRSTVIVPAAAAERIAARATTLKDEEGIADGRYVVRKGDTLASVARRFNLTVSELREINRFSRSHKLRAGEKVRLVGTVSITAGGM